jgi:uracil-DNA glycosylase
MILEDSIVKIKTDEENREFTKKGWIPIVTMHQSAKILIIGHAPGIKTQREERSFYDKSGVRLRQWMHVSEAEFYESTNFAVLPLDFYFSGKGKTGDNPPRKHFAAKWHPQLLKLMPNIELIILAGVHAQKEYLGDRYKKNLTETMRSYKEYLPKYFPIIHPSPINQRWIVKNSFFKEEVLLDFHRIINNIINTK